MRTNYVDLLQVSAILYLLASHFEIYSIWQQFHWNDYSDSSYLVALHHLKELQAEGHIRLLGLCNFDAIRTDEICTRLGPGSIVTNQVQVGATSFKFLTPLEFEVSSH